LYTLKCLYHREYPRPDECRLVGLMDIFIPPFHLALPLEWWERVSGEGLDSLRSVAYFGVLMLSLVAIFPFADEIPILDGNKY
jgi:hypothetical protein